jgi:hypothetical protein
MLCMLLCAIMLHCTDHVLQLYMQQFMKTDSLLVFDCISKEDVMKVIQLDVLVFRVARLADRAVTICTSSSSSSSSIKVQFLKELVDDIDIPEVTALLEVSSNQLHDYSKLLTWLLCTQSQCPY